MENSRQCSLGMLTTAALVGGLAGAVVGLLLAPKSGRDLRRDLLGKAEILADQVGDPPWLDKGKQIVEDMLAFTQEFPGAPKPGYTTIKVVRNPSREDPAESHDFSVPEKVFIDK